MPTFDVVVSFDGIDIEDLDQLEELALVAPGTHFWSVDGQTRAVAVVEAASAVEAVRRLASEVESATSSPMAVRPELALLTVSDIAAIVRLNRESVRLWTTGQRGPGGFPLALATVGGGTRVWAASDVVEWLQRHSLPHPDARPLSPHEVADAARMLEARGKSTLQRREVVSLLQWRAVMGGVALEPAMVPVRHIARGDVQREFAT